MGLSIFDEHLPYFDLETITDAWGTAMVPVIGDQVQGVRLDQIILTNDDVIDHEIQLWGGYAGTPLSLMGTVNVPSLAGTDSAHPPVDAIAALPVLIAGVAIAPHFSIAIGPLVAVTAGQHVYATVLGGYI